jgi:hypothetical protein
LPLCPHYILWRIYTMQELLSHRGLGACAQWESCGLDRRVARRQLCEHLDYATVEQAVFRLSDADVTLQQYCECHVTWLQTDHCYATRLR